MNQIFKDWTASIDLSKTRIDRFPSYIILCGGPISNTLGVNKSCRDAFLRYIKQHNVSFISNVLLAEEVFSYFEHADKYGDLLSFEKDLATLSSLTVIISESPGSIAELGSFSILPPVKDKLLVVLNQDNANQESFIWRGPILYLKNKAEKSGKSNPISIYNWSGSDENSINQLNDSDAGDLATRIEILLAEVQKTSIFKKNEASHIMLLIIDILNIVQLATYDDIHFLLEKFGINSPHIKTKRYISLLFSLKMLVRQDYGHNVFYISPPSAPWITWAYASGAKIRDAARWRTMFLEFIEINQPNRYGALRSYFSSASSIQG